MIKLTLGEMLYRFRIERELEAKQICEGLCSTSAMSFFENGERMPDIILFEYLVERMGVSCAEFSIMVTEEEYEYYEWKEQVYTAIDNENWDELGLLLQANTTKKIYCNERLEEQFLLYARAIYEASKGKYELSAILIKSAVEKTMLGIMEKESIDISLGNTELHMLILYLYYGIKGNALAVEKGWKLFITLEKYVYTGIRNMSEIIKSYPKLICVGLHCFRSSITKERQLEYCERAIEILQRDKFFEDITEILYFYIQLLEQMKSDKLGFYKKQYEVFCDLLQSEDERIDFRPEKKVFQTPKLYIINEYFYSKRKECDITQELLSEGICEPQTYSRIESGKRAPSRKNLYKIAERLDINWGYYRGELDTCELKAFQLRRLQRRRDAEGRTQEALQILKELERYLDMSIVTNIQYIKLQECVAEYQLGLCTTEKAYEALVKTLQLTRDINNDTDTLVYYSQTELEIIGEMAQLLKKQQNPKLGIKLIETVIKQMSNGSLSLDYQWSAFNFLFRVLSGLYFSIGNYETSLNIARYVKKTMIRRKIGSVLPEVLDEIADNLEHMGEQYSDEYKKLYRYTYYLADFYSIIRITKFAKTYYEENFDEKIKWYED